MRHNQSGGLLAYLALHLNKSHTREELATVFWPDEDPQTALQRLRKTLHVLRRQLEQAPFAEGEILLAARATVQLSPEIVRTDVIEFEEALRRANLAPDLQARTSDLMQALSIYQGELLPGCYLDGFLAERRRYADIHWQALIRLSEALEEAGDTDRALEYARQAVTLEPLAEDAHCRLMRLYAATGQPSAMLRQFQELKRTLKEQLGIEPGMETMALVESLSRSSSRTNGANGNNDRTAQAPLVSAPVSENKATGASEISATAAPHHAGTSPIHRSQSRRLANILVAAGAVLLLAIWVGLGAMRRSSQHSKTASRSTPHGHLFWRQRYKPKLGDRDSQPVAIKADRDGYTIVGGFVQTLKSDVDAVIDKFDPYGNTVWEYRFDGEAHDMDRLTAMTVGQDGSTYAAIESMGKKGSGKERLSELDIVVVKVSPDGNERWRDTYRGKANGLDSPADLALDASGNLYVVGRSSQDGAAEHAVVALKYSPIGKRLWEYRSRSAGIDERAVNLAVDNTGVYVAAHSAARTGRLRDTDLLIKLSSAGKEIWRYDNPGILGGSLCAPRVAVDVNHSVYFATQAPGTRQGISRIEMTSVLPTGRPIWRWEMPATADDSDFPSDIKPDPRGGVVICGLRTKPVAYIMCAGLLSNGDARYIQKLYTDPGPQSPYPTFSIDSKGNIALIGSIFTGITGVNGHDSDVLSAFILNDGSLAWQHQLDGADHLTDYGDATSTVEGRIYMAVQVQEGGVREIQLLRYSPFPE